MPEVGIEPTRTRSPEDFESSASTSFTTPASGCNYSEIGYLVNIISLKSTRKGTLPALFFLRPRRLDGENANTKRSGFRCERLDENTDSLDIHERRC